ncbi:DNA excision repair protein ERCC-5-like isoform X2 [Watersipora subatra]
MILHQALKGMKDQPNAHLHLLFLRLCKLLMYRIKPIFVFDGSVPILKRHTIAARQKRREESSALAQSIRERLKKKAIQRLAVDESLGVRPTVKRLKASEQDLFELPPLPKDETLAESDDYFELPIHNMLYSGELDLNQVKADSEEFKLLPLEYQHEILEELKEKTKHDNSFSLNDEEKADDFSSFQIAKLVKSNKLTNKIEVLRKEMLAGFSDHVPGENYDVLQANRVASEDSTHYLLIKSLATGSETAPTTSGDESKLLAANDSPINEVSKSSTQFLSEASATSRPLSDSDSEQDNEEETRDSTPEITASKNTSLPSKRFKTHFSPDLSDDDSDKEEPKQEKNDNSHFNTEEHSKMSETLLKDDNPEAIDKQRVEYVGSYQPEAVSNNIPCKSESETIGYDSVTSETVPDEDLSQQLKTVCKSLFDAYTKENLMKESTISEVIGQSSTGINQTREMLDEKSSRVEEVASVQIKVDVSSDAEEDLSDDKQTLEDSQPVSYNTVMDGLAEEILNSKRELAEVQEELQSSQYYLNLDLEKQHASSLAVTQHIMDESMELLKLFGVPYIVAPAEAEAQCAQLEILGLCNGTITDDSDVWLFGGSRVLKNFFHQDRYITSFTAKDIERFSGLDRKKLIAVALVCGSDYTEGIYGAGPVTATEILSEFGRDCDGIVAMEKFKAWIDEVKQKPGVMPLNPGNSAVRSKLRRHSSAVPDGFPNRVVVDAYLNPSVDHSSEQFEWGRADLDLLRKFAHKTLNWSTQKVDDLVCPVLKKQNEARSQLRMTDFFNSFPTSINTDGTFQSKRLKQAFAKLTSSPSKSPGTTQVKSSTVKPGQKKRDRTLTVNSKGMKGKRHVEKMPSHPNNRLIEEHVCLSEDSD